MPSPEWFFSTLSQSMGAIVGFIITIAAVLYQLEKNEKQNRTARLREELIEFEKKYNNAIFSAIEGLKQPFEDSLPSSEYDPENSSLEDIKNIPDEDLEGHPITSRVWMVSYHISCLLDRVSPDESPERHYLLSKADVEEIEASAEYLSNHIIGEGDSIVYEISYSGAVDKDEISASDEIFDTESIEYIDLDRWFSSHFEQHQEESQLDGSDLISLHNFYQELYHDSRILAKSSQNTILEQNSTISKLLAPIIGLIIVGVVLPLLSLLSLPGGGISIGYTLLSIYQATLVGVSTFLSIHIICAIWSNI